eukprot:m.150435 g.150435  ORF g.150435 m.150435 type:complete len:265 (-) comp17380_c0_seq2:84-878(-)
MVSLNDTQNGGGFFFNGDEGASSSLLSVPESGLQLTKTPHRLKTTWTAIIEIVLLIGAEAVLFTRVLHSASHRLELTPANITLLIQALLWLVNALMTAYRQRLHTLCRARGYLRQHRDTETLRKTPFLTLSFGNVLQLVFAAVIKDNGKWGLSVLDVFRIIVSLQAAVCVVAHGLYTVKISRFNAAKADPDVDQELKSHSRPQYDVDYDDDNALMDVLYKQSDLIRYMQQSQTNMSRRLAYVTKQLDNYERGVYKLHQPNFGPA